jgi:hypothetical protein
MGLLGAGAYERVRARPGVASALPLGGVPPGERCGESEAVDFVSDLVEVSAGRRSVRRSGVWSMIGTLREEGSAAARLTLGAGAGGGVGLRGGSGMCPVRLMGAGVPTRLASFSMLAC